MVPSTIGREGPLSIGCVLMASGLGRRFGGNKLLASFGDRRLVQCILDTTKDALDSKVLDARVVVTRHEEVMKLCQDQNIPVILHDLPGRNDTVRLGLEALESCSLDGCFFCPCDQPLLSLDSFSALTEAFFQDPTYIYRLGFGETVGTPVLFPSDLFEELKHLPEGKGGSVILKKYPERVRTLQARSGLELADADTPEQLSAMEREWKACIEKVK